jgi:hypothetical protein
MKYRLFMPALAAIALVGFTLPARAADTDGNIQSLVAAFPAGPNHGMPDGTAGGDGAIYAGPPDLQVASSLVTAGGGAGTFSIVTALTAMAGQTVAEAEVAKLTRQYGQARVASYVLVQNFAVDDAVRLATIAGVQFPTATLTGAELAKQVVSLGLLDGTYYEGYMLDHVVSSEIHGTVMSDIDGQYGTVADANYHLISDQAHYDLAQALGVTIGLAAYH